MKDTLAESKPGWLRQLQCNSQIRRARSGEGYLIPRLQSHSTWEWMLCNDDTALHAQERVSCAACIDMVLAAKGYTPSVPHFAYIARCADDTLYVGTCIDLTAREALHNAGKGSKYTRSRLPVQFVYHEEHPTLSAVRKREAAMKKLSRTDKLALIGRG